MIGSWVFSKIVIRPPGHNGFSCPPVLSGLEIDGVPDIPFSRRLQMVEELTVHIFESLILVHALAVLGKVKSGRNEIFLLSACWRSRYGP